MEQISRNVFFLSSPELAGAARSGECDQPLCLSVLSGEICGVTWANRASQLSGKIITQSRTFWITLEAIGRLGCGMDLCVTKTPLNETLPHHTGQEPHRELRILREQAKMSLWLTEKHTLNIHCCKAAAPTETLYGMKVSPSGVCSFKKTFSQVEYLKLL